MNWKGARRTERGGRRLFSPKFCETFDLRMCATTTDRPFRPAGASDTVPSVRPAPRPCVSRALPSAWFLPARQLFLWRRTRERSEDGSRRCRTPVKVFKDLLDQDWIFNARNHLDRTTTVFTGLDLDLEHPLQPLRPCHRNVRGDLFSGLGGITPPARTPFYLRDRQRKRGRPGYLQM